MQRYRRDEVGVGQQRIARAPHPAREGRRRVRAVGMLEAQDQVLAAVVIAEGGAGAFEHRPPAGAGAAQRVRPEIDLERQAAGRALWRRQEGDGRPAACAQRTDGIDRRPAFKAARRQDDVEHPIAGALDAGSKQRGGRHG
jgi:hypothetical protein